MWRRFTAQRTPRAAQRCPLAQPALPQPPHLSPLSPAGGAGAARNLKALRKVGVTHILTASPAVPCFFADNPPERAFRYLSLRLWDDPGADLGEHLPAASPLGSKKEGVALGVPRR